LCIHFEGYGLWVCYINAVRLDVTFISPRTKLRTMSQNSMSLDYEPIQPTQSIEYILETETQEDLPETQESVTNFDIFIYDDLGDTEEQDPVTHDECVTCGNIVTANPFPQRRKWSSCASCVIVSSRLRNTLGERENCIRVFFSSRT